MIEPKKRIVTGSTKDLARECYKFVIENYAEDIGKEELDEISAIWLDGYYKGQKVLMERLKLLQAVREAQDRGDKKHCKGKLFTPSSTTCINCEEKAECRHLFVTSDTGEAPPLSKMMPPPEI